MREDYRDHPESKLLLEAPLKRFAGPAGISRIAMTALGIARLADLLYPEKRSEQFSPRSERLTDGTRVHLISRLYRLDGHPLLIRLAYSEEPIWSRMRELATASLLALPPGARAKLAGPLPDHRRGLYTAGRDGMPCRTDNLRTFT